MDKFSKKFPSWDGKSIITCIENKEHDLLSKEWILTHCLDKERVRKAIEKHDDCAFGDCCFECQSNNNPEKLDCFKYILKELEL